MPLRLAEDVRDGAREELRQGKEARERQQRELWETRRALGDESWEKATLQQSNAELRAAVTQTQSGRSSLQRRLEEKQREAAVLGEAKAAVQKEAEKSRAEALRELRRQGQTLGGENSEQGREVSELQAQLRRQEQQSHGQALEPKQRAAGLEAGQEEAGREQPGLVLGPRGPSCQHLTRFPAWRAALPACALCQC
ncbi:uncharacterized protein LOC142825753 isoform X2 [Pelodiscus sinensis]|uniref:uncharacterized protein LOC142825753 isoform X2 n=1 Tax=Pelodiscus sinensis TaxID=13735 RepID=UPI003F6BAB4E